MSEKLSDDQAAQIGSALESGNRIEAIKLYRSFTGSDLKTARDAIEALGAGLLQRQPEKYAKLAQARGCATRAAMFALALAAGIVLFRLR